MILDKEPRAQKWGEKSITGIPQQRSAVECRIQVHDVRAFASDGKSEPDQIEEKPEGLSYARFVCRKPPKRKRRHMHARATLEFLEKRSFRRENASRPKRVDLADENADGKRLQFHKIPAGPAVGKPHAQALHRPIARTPMQPCVPCPRPLNDACRPESGDSRLSPRGLAS